VFYKDTIVVGGGKIIWHADNINILLL
jgi:hypothetical protein